MAEMTIRLQIDPETGKKNIIVSMRSDEDALPHEHEQQHRAIVDKLIQGGIVSATELGKIIVERAEGEDEASPTASPTPEREAHRQGN